MKTIHTILAMLLLAFAASLTAAPDIDPADHAAHVAADPAAHQTTAKPSSGDSALAHDLSAMREKVARLEAALRKMSGGSMGNSSSDTSDGGMRMMGGKGMKNMEGMKKMKGMGMMQMDKMKMSGMMGKSPMKESMQGAVSSSALPGFPGASHLYHLGSTGFFLDHESHIALSIEQSAALNQIKEQTALAASSSDRAIEQAEQELWQLTSGDQPDIAAIEAKASEIAKIVAKRRVAFIRAVGEAAKLLTDGQRKSLTGFAPPAPAMEGM